MEAESSGKTCRLSIQIVANSYWYHKPELRPHPELRIHSNFSPHQGDELFWNRQSETRSTITPSGRVVRLLKGNEQHADVMRR